MLWLMCSCHQLWMAIHVEINPDGNANTQFSSCVFFNKTITDIECGLCSNLYPFDSKIINIVNIVIVVRQWELLTQIYGQSNMFLQTDTIISTSHTLQRPCGPVGYGLICICDYEEGKRKIVLFFIIFHMLPYRLFIWAGPIAHFGHPLFKSWLKACSAPLKKLFYRKIILFIYLLN